MAAAHSRHREGEVTLLPPLPLSLVRYNISGSFALGLTVGALSPSAARPRDREGEAPPRVDTPLPLSRG